MTTTKKTTTRTKLFLVMEKPYTIHWYTPQTYEVGQRMEINPRNLDKDEGYRITLGHGMDEFIPPKYFRVEKVTIKRKVKTTTEILTADQVWERAHAELADLDPQDREMPTTPKTQTKLDIVTTKKFTPAPGFTIPAGTPRGFDPNKLIRHERGEPAYSYVWDGVTIPEFGADGTKNFEITKETIERTEERTKKRT